ncbi:hypothetical protein KSP39_PZI016689 [Platanthera zijinensis]|uniref:Uncharacterized protein n=1 Tax=Platanthera zijinensis TaxID=2320716 RepID=A0AAP0B868_9ASPA
MRGRAVAAPAIAVEPLVVEGSLSSLGYDRHFPKKWRSACSNPSSSIAQPDRSPPSTLPRNSANAGEVRRKWQGNKLSMKRAQTPRQHPKPPATIKEEKTREVDNLRRHAKSARKAKLHALSRKRAKEYCQRSTEARHARPSSSVAESYNSKGGEAWRVGHHQDPSGVPRLSALIAILQCANTLSPGPSIFSGHNLGESTSSLVASIFLHLVAILDPSIFVPIIMFLAWIDTPPVLILEKKALEGGFTEKKARLRRAVLSAARL